jgi:hypothetical protein
MQKSTRTKKLSKVQWLLRGLHILLNVAPIIVFIIIAFIHGDIGTKATLGCTAIVALIMTLVAWTNKMAMKSRIWVVLIGVWLALDSFMIPLITIASTQLVDEIFIEPMMAANKTKLVANR